MYISEAFNAIPELAHLDEARFFQDCDAAWNNSNPKTAYAALGKQSKLGPFLEGGIVRGTTQEQNDLIVLPIERRVRIETRLVRRPNQRLAKHVRCAWWSPRHNECHATDMYFPIQFLGYGSYSLCHYNSASNPAPMTGFFAALEQNHVNFHRTFLFTSGNYEIQNQTTVPLLAIHATDKHKSTVHPDFLANLERMATAARARNIVLQICLFPRQSIAGASYMPLPAGITSADLGGTGQTAVGNFFKVDGPWQPLQENIIDTLAARLMSHWNVVWEIGNELFASADQQMKEWVAWAADRIHRKTYGKLVTVSGSRENEPSLCTIPQIDFLSFHRGQWDPTTTTKAPETIEKARKRAQESYGGKHVVIDDDGSALNRDIPGMVTEWAVSALGAGNGGPCSFNHKGPYNPMAANGFGDSLDELQALSLAWQAVFQSVSPGVNIFVPKPKIQIPV